jgi:hypothetical protein
MQNLQLKKDVKIPGRYFRAGETGTLEQWETIFAAKILKSDIDEWFIDMNKIKQPEKQETLTKIINEVFESHGLYSMSYKHAAKVVALKYAELVLETKIAEKAKIL